MKSFFWILIIAPALIASLCEAQGTVSPNQVDEFLDKILSERLEYRLSKSSCASGPSILDELKATKLLPVEQRVFADSELFLKSAGPECEREVDREDRADFTGFFTAFSKACSLTNSSSCTALVQQVQREIDPMCPAFYSRDINGAFTRRACYGGAPLFIASLYDANHSTMNRVQAFLNSLLFAVKNSDGQSPIDLWTSFKFNYGESGESREKFLATIAAVTAVPDAVSGQIDPIAEGLYLKALKDEKNPESAVALFRQFKWSAEKMTLIKLAREKGNISLVAEGQNLNKMKHHDFMAAFLACHYRNNGKFQSEYLPRILGKLYKGQRFIAHEEEGWKLQDSWKNFKDDSYRYRLASEWGLKFCSVSKP